MQPEERYPSYLLDMLTACRKVVRYIDGKDIEDLKGDDLLRDGVVRNIEIIGEAASKVSTEFRSENTGIPWREIIAQRNVLIHEYEEISDDEVWAVATIHIPKLIQQLEPLIPPLSGD